MKIEHVALNVKDPVGMAGWYVKHLGMRIVRKFDDETHTHFIADSEGTSMLELYCNPPDQVPDYASLDPHIIHIAFQVSDAAAMSGKLIAAGAKLESEETTPAGDQLVMLRDPWGLALQLARRAKKML